MFFREERRHPIQKLTIHPKFSLIQHKTCDGEPRLVELLRAIVWRTIFILLSWGGRERWVWMDRMGGERNLFGFELRSAKADDRHPIYEICTSKAPGWWPESTSLKFFVSISVSTCPCHNFDRPHIVWLRESWVQLPDRESYGYPLCFFQLACTQNMMANLPPDLLLLR